MSQGAQIDYDALAKQAGALSSQPGQQGGAVDYDALARQAGAISSQPPKASAASRFGKSYLSGVGVTSDEEAKNFFVHPLDTLRRILTANRDVGNQAYQEIGQGNYAQGLPDLAYAAIPFLGPGLSKSAHQLTTGDIAGGAGTALGAGTSLALGAKLAPQSTVAPTPSELSGSVVRNTRGPGPLASTLRQRPAGEEFTRGEVLDYARSQGVNPDLADVTGSGAAGGLKGFAERSLAGRGVMQRNAQANLQAVQGAADQELTKYAPVAADRNALGTAIQQRLQQNLAGLKQQAGQQFEDLDQTVGSNPVNVSGTVQATAKQVIAQNQAYYAAHPELQPRAAWNIVKDLASGEQGPKTMSWSELHTLRSDLMDFYRNSPDIVKSRSDAWIQQLVGKIDNSMNDAASGLTPAQTTQFRAANATWEQLKSTYDNPQHPFFAATRAQMPSQVPQMLANKTPELAGQARDALGPLYGHFQRDFVNRLLDPNGDGVYDLAGLNARVNRLPADYLNAMLGPEGARNLRLLAKTSKTVTANINPSGTSNVLVPAAEVSGLFAHPLAAAGELAGAYGTARGLTSQAVIDAMTRRPGLTPGAPPTLPWLRVAGAPTAAGVAGQSQGPQNPALPFLRRKQ